MRKYLLVGLVTSCLFLSCEKDPAPIEPEKEETPVERNVLEDVIMVVDKSKVNIFEDVYLNMYVGEDRNPASPFLLAGNTELFDSAVWSIPEVLYAKSLPSSVTGGMGQSFTKPGTYTFSLSFYKDAKVIQSRQLDILVVDERDFLNIIWRDGNKNQGGYFQRSAKDYSLSTKYYNEVKPYVTLEIAFSPEGKATADFLERIQQGDTELASLLTSLYGAAKVSRIDQPDAEDVEALYEELFHNKLDNATPKAIWQTTTSNIVIVEREQGDGLKYYSAVAEQL
ncbi:hypothetical protein [Sphingobacterium bambusae]|uniref:DUF4625 domain-containing protein n=1 Tax=Sphingobacterium bambusae TaxID=662858 RepID=A0ABW6BJN5_9SPHI|nr:hypothetical protein [Sphingobacterium bambusae]WPL50046.1 hypothetical protein SCB77_06235 [Sphingobacterium bambusae]